MQDVARSGEGVSKECWMIASRWRGNIGWRERVRCVGYVQNRRAAEQYEHQVGTAEFLQIREHLADPRRMAEYFTCVGSLLAEMFWRDFRDQQKLLYAGGPRLARAPSNHGGRRL
jgi:hypothetical protein